MQGNTTFQTRAQHAATELKSARTALCQAMLKVQALERERLKEDDAYRRLLPAGWVRLCSMLSSQSGSTPASYMPDICFMQDDMHS